MSSVIEQVLLAHASESGRAFLERALEQASSPAWMSPFALAVRKLPPEPVGLGENERRELGGHAWLFAGSPAFEVARVAILLRGSKESTLLAECFRQGDNGEKRAVLRSLALMPSPAELVELAIAACRTNVVSVLDAIACRNPFPARHFPDPSFNQLVLKAVFASLPLASIMDLDSRKNPELSRMARDYAAERRTAGRGVPGDLELILRGAS